MRTPNRFADNGFGVAIGAAGAGKLNGAPSVNDSIPGPVPAPAAADPSELAPEGTRTPAPTGDLTVVDLRRLWPDIIEAIKERKRTTAALLMSASVLGVEGSLLKLGINSSGLMRRLSEEMNTEIIRAALLDKLGVNWQVQTIVDAGEKQQSLQDPDPAARRGTLESAVEVATSREVGKPDAQGSNEPVDSEQAALSLLRDQLGAPPSGQNRRTRSPPSVEPFACCCSSVSARPSARPTRATT